MGRRPGGDGLGHALSSWPPGRRRLLIRGPHPVPKQAKLTEAEAKLLNAAHRYQQSTDFHLGKPEGF